jgi:hypothetical protein
VVKIQEKEQERQRFKRQRNRVVRKNAGAIEESSKMGLENMHGIFQIPHMRGIVVFPGSGLFCLTW